MYCVPRAQQQSLKAFFSKPIFFSKVFVFLDTYTTFLHKAIFFPLKREKQLLPSTYYLQFIWCLFSLSSNEIQTILHQQQCPQKITRGVIAEKTVSHLLVCTCVNIQHGLPNWIKLHNNIIAPSYNSKYMN